MNDVLAGIPSSKSKRKVLLPLTYAYEPQMEMKPQLAK